MMFGVDTASVAGNKNIDWQKARAAGCSFAILRAHYGVTRDKQFLKEVVRARDAGMVVGGYLFLRFPSAKQKRVASPVTQANAFLTTLQESGIYDQNTGVLPPVIDVEFPGKGSSETGLSPRALLDGVESAWRYCKDQWTQRPMIYTSARVWSEDLINLVPHDLDMLESPLWVARYPFKMGTSAVYDASKLAKFPERQPSPPPWGLANTWIWQYHGNALNFPGFSGAVDMNRFEVMLPGEQSRRVTWMRRAINRWLSGGSDRVGGPKITDVCTYDKPLALDLRRLQTSFGLVPDGIVGPRTFAVLCAQ